MFIDKELTRERGRKEGGREKERGEMGEKGKGR